MLSKAIFVATKESPQKIIAAFNAIYILSSSVCFKSAPVIKRSAFLEIKKSPLSYQTEVVHIYFSSAR